MPFKWLKILHNDKVIFCAHLFKKKHVVIEYSLKDSNYFAMVDIYVISRTLGTYAWITSISGSVSNLTCQQDSAQVAHRHVKQWPGVMPKCI